MLLQIVHAEKTSVTFENCRKIAMKKMVSDLLLEKALITQSYTLTTIGFTCELSNFVFH